MPRYGVMIWNVEKMGNYFPAQQLGVSKFVSSLLSSHALALHNINVLIIQELRHVGVPMLAQIVDNLNPTAPAAPAWDYDFIPAGIPPGFQPELNRRIRARDANAVIEELARISNNEGYGIIFRRGALQQIRTQMPLSAKSFASLCFSGYEGVLSQEDQLVPMVESEAGMPAAVVPFPISNTPTAAALFGRTAERARERRNEDRRQKDMETAEDGAVQEQRVRRPCRVDLDCGGTIVNVLAYHAPVGGAGPMFGAACTALLTEVQSARGRYPNVIVAGDYNFRSSADIDGSFERIVQHFGFVAATRDATGHYQGTSIHEDGTITSPRDLLFYRLGAPIANPSIHPNNVVDIIGILTNPPPDGRNVNPFAEAILTDLNLRATVAASNASQGLKTLFSQPNIVDGFTDQLAAEFYWFIISDHLPVMLSFEV